tara:strand:- start:356 stop:541 length:186 start_codon:yes stop_codon:yes gene_type:complete
MRKRKQKRLARRHANQLKHEGMSDQEAAAATQAHMRDTYGLDLDIGAIFKLIQLILDLFRK